MTMARLFRRRLGLVVAAVVLCPVAGPVTAADVDPPAAAVPASWPQWHGADRTNVSSETHLLAVWPATGPRLVWTAAGCGKGYSSVTVADGRIYTADSGRLLWRYPFTNKRKINANTPLYRDGAVFITTGYGAGGVMLGLAPLGERFAATQVWSSADLDAQHGGAVLVGGAIYGSGHESPGWTCLDFATGKLCYRDRSLGQGSLTVAGDMLYCLSEKGTVALVHPSRTAFEIVSRFDLPKSANGPVWAHPVVCGGRLYVRHGDLLYCYDIAAD